MESMHMMMVWRESQSQWELHQEDPDGELYYSPSVSTRYTLLCSSATNAVLPGPHAWTFYNKDGFETRVMDIDTSLTHQQ